MPYYLRGADVIRHLQLEQQKVPPPAHLQDSLCQTLQHVARIKIYTCDSIQRKSEVSTLIIHPQKEKDKKQPEKQ